MDLIEIKLPKCTVFLYPYEIDKLLMKDEGLYKKALGRGKAILRNRNMISRNRVR